MPQLLHDLKHAVRMFGESPGFTAAVIAALTIGIGVNTAIFSVVNSVLLKPLPFADQDTLVAVENTSHGAAYGPWTSPAKFTYWRAQTDVFSDVAAIDQYPRYLNYTDGDTPQQLMASRVSASYFRVLDAPIIRGRPFTAEEDSPSGPNVAVISYAFWQQRLNGAEDVLGTTLPLSGESYTIVGILERSFDADPYFDAGSLSGQPDLLLPFQLDPNSTDEANFFANIARLKQGVTLAEAQARVAASATAFRQRYPAMPETEGFTVLEARQAMATMFGDPRPRLWLLLGAVGFVLLIACANVANLLLMRATGRAHEIAIRSALGAGRARILRLLLTESLLLSLVGGVLGLGMGSFGIRALLAVNTAGLPRLGPGGALVDMDWRVVTFTLGLSLATGLVFGLAPAVVGSRSDLNTVIKGSGSRSGGGFRQNKARSTLVTVEVGLAVVLLIGAALLIRTSVALGRVDPGFDASHVLTMQTMFSGARLRTSEGIAQTVRAGLERVRQMPGVESAAVTSSLPPGSAQPMVFNIAGRPDDKGPWTGSAGDVMVSEDYFAALGIPVIAGRAFTARDDAGAPPVAVINQTMAKRFWANGLDPLQDRLQIGLGVEPPGSQPERRVVGIVGDVHYGAFMGGAMHGGLDKEAMPVMYVPAAQLTEAQLAALSGWPTVWVVHSRDSSAVQTLAIQNAIREATGFPAENVQPLEHVLWASVSRQRLNMLLMSIFGGAALLLAVIGIYGLLAYSVQQRVQEIGIRIALGADAQRVKRMVVRQGMVLVGAGVTAGLVAAFYMADVLTSFLFEVRPRDPAAFVAVPVVLALIALVSVWVPAGRASRVNPLDALRYE
jgi:putative ABC transport system permease protein